MHGIGELKSIIDKQIGDLSFNGTPRDLYDPISYMLSLDAKRMRPVMVLCGCELFNGDITNALNPALGIEVFHNFTLLHDDIMDNAPLRRAKQTVHTKWNTNVAILSGDTMFVKACQLMMKTNDQVVRPVMELFHKTAIEVCEGQQMDMDFESSNDVSIQDYITMITYKTAVLLACSLETGAIVAGANQQDAHHIYEFGKNIGIGFQLKDDILDVFGDHQKFGKLKGGDIIANKKTFLWLKACELATGTDADELKRLSSTLNQNADEKVQAVTSIYEKLGIAEISEKEINKYFLIALNHLDAILVPASQKSVLRGFAETLMLREV